MSPNFKECDYAIGFDNITYNDRFLNFPLFLIYSQLEQAKHKHENVTAVLYNKKDIFCNYIVGNSKGMAERTEIFNLINDYNLFPAWVHIKQHNPNSRYGREKIAFPKQMSIFNHF